MLPIQLIDNRLLLPKWRKTAGSAEGALYSIWIAVVRVKRLQMKRRAVSRQE